MLLVRRIIRSSDFMHSHLSVGLLAMMIVLWLQLTGPLTESNKIGAELVSWYWHFVDGVWIVVFIVVYLVGR